MRYAAGMWRFYGVNLLDQDRLTFVQFLDMCDAVDQYERQQKREADNAGS